MDAAPVPHNKITQIFFLIAWGLYLSLLLVKLEEFPNYFFCDEPYPTIVGEQVIRNNFRGQDGELLPVYFVVSTSRTSPLLSVYIQGVSALLFGKSIFVTRATTALVGFFGFLLLGFALARATRLTTVWALPLVLLSFSIWFLHTRTGFEVAMMVGVYAAAFASYLLYRFHSPWWLLPCVLFSGAAFYLYSNGQIIVPAVVAGLLLSDWKFHRKNFRYFLYALPFLLLTAYPAYRMMSGEHSILTEHLRTIGSFVTQKQSSAQTLASILHNYFSVLDPRFWFLPRVDLIRHRVGDLPYFSALLAPFFLIGVLTAVRRITQPFEKSVIILALASLASSLVVDAGATRQLAFVVPAAILCLIGFDWVVSSLRKYTNPSVVALVLFVFLGGLVTSVARAAFAVPILASADYGFYGLQWGTKEIFVEKIPEYLRQNPGSVVHLTSEWANASERFIPFFFSPSDEQRVKIANLDFLHRQPLNADDIYIVIPAVLQKVRESGKFKNIRVIDTLRFPNGSEALYSVKVEYVDNIDEIFRVERQARLIPDSSSVTVQGHQAEVVYSKIDIGPIENVFDNDPATLARGLELNPFQLAVKFTQTVPMKGVKINLAIDNPELLISIFERGGDTPAFEMRKRFSGVQSTPIAIEFPQKINAMRFVMSALDPEQSDTANIHIRDVVFE